MIIKMMYRQGFKIRKMADAEKVLNEVLNRDTIHRFAIYGNAHIDLYQEHGKWVADYGWNENEWISLRMDMNAFDVVWRYRKFINAEWFNDKE